MKLTVKHKAEKNDQYNMRMPASLKQNLVVLAERASNHGVDLNATQVSIMEQMVAELNERFDVEDRTVRENPNKVIEEPSRVAPESFPNGGTK
jgi:hypothetical protein